MKAAALLINYFVQYDFMKKIFHPLIIIFITFFISSEINAQQLAFPGAEGFGRHTTGGRGGKVLEVTNLNDSGAGSLRDALGKNYPRIIVFKVSGTIQLKSALRIKYDNLTIAGQTAPGDGICIRDYPVVLQANNIIVRFIRFRLGDVNKIEDDSFWGRELHNVILDHCSMSWAIDENGSWYDNKNFTMQWCINGESLYHSFHSKGDHGYGGIWGGAGATFHHNLIADNTSRNPRFNGARYTTTHETELADFRNNVIFNWGFNSAYGGESGNYNMVNNYFKPGPATSSGNKQYRIVNPSEDFNPSAGYSQWFIDGNFIEGNADVTADNWNGGVQPDHAPLDSIRSIIPLPFDSVKTETAEEAYNSVLEFAGAYFPKRDSVDLRIINEVKTGLAPFGATYNGGNKGIIDSPNDVGGYPLLESTEPPTDSDHDGMPDDWEIANSLNPNDSSDARLFTTDGYTMIENYINGLLLTNPTEVRDKNISQPENFILYQNYPNPFNPATKIKFEIPIVEKRHSLSVQLKVYDVLGNKIATLVDEEKAVGEYEVEFSDIIGNSNSLLPSGIYFYRLQAGEFFQTKKMILLK